MTAWSEPAPRPRSQSRQSRYDRPRRTWVQRILVAVGIIATFSTVVAAAGLTWALQRYKDIEFLNVPSVEAASPGEPSNWLLVGSDSREGIDPNDPNAGIFLGETVEGKRTDTIMVARVDPDGRTIDLLSVPRDLWVPISGTDSNGRVNSAFNGEDGEQRLVSTIEDFLGIEINNYAEINFVGFQAIIDSLGGVPIWFDTPVRDPKSALDISTPGCHSLSGFDALAFARSRSLEYFEDDRWKTDPTGDLGRTARQQYLLSRLAATASQKLDLTDLGTVDRILRSGGQNLVIDDGAGATDLFALARTFAAVGAEGIIRHSLPVEGFRTGGGAAVLALLREEAEPTLKVFRGIVPTDPAPPSAPSEETVPTGSFVVEIWNGAAIEGLAGTTAEELRAAGFNVDGINNAPAVVETTIVRYPPGFEVAASVLGRRLTAPPVYEVDETLTNVLLVLGPDYAGVSDTPTTVEPAAEAAPQEQVPGENEVGRVPGVGPEGTPCA